MAASRTESEVPDCAPTRLTTPTRPGSPNKLQRPGPKLTCEEGWCHGFVDLHFSEIQKREHLRQLAYKPAAAERERLKAGRLEGKDADGCALQADTAQEREVKLRLKYHIGGLQLHIQNLQPLAEGCRNLDHGRLPAETV